MHTLEEDTSSVAGSTIRITPSGSSSTDMENSKLILGAVLVLACCSFVAVVLAAVALSNSKDTPNINIGSVPGSGSSSGGGQQQPTVTTGAGTGPAGTGVRNADGKRIFTVAIGHDWGAHEYIDEEGYISGFSKDVIREVCRAAGIDCRTVWDKTVNCVDSTAGEHTSGGKGLLGGWYDGCMGWDQSVNRIEIFQFGIPYLDSPSQGFFVKKGSNFDATDITGKKIGFIDGWVYDEKCIARQSSITGSKLMVDQIFHYAQAEDAIAALNTGKVDALSGDIQVYHEWITNDQLEKRGDFKCELGGSTMMARKDSDFISIWNVGFQKIQTNGVFAKLCAEGLKTHGQQGPIPCVQ